MPSPPSPKVHRLALLDIRYLEEHSTNDLHLVGPEHVELVSGTGWLVVELFNSSGQEDFEQWPYSCWPIMWLPWISVLVEHQYFVGSSGSTGHLVYVCPLWVNGNIQALFTFGPLTVLHMGAEPANMFLGLTYAKYRLAKFCCKLNTVIYPHDIIVLINHTL